MLKSKSTYKREQSELLKVIGYLAATKVYDEAFIATNTVFSSHEDSKNGC
jgi:hypothetical protein